MLMAEPFRLKNDGRFSRHVSIGQPPQRIPGAGEGQFAGQGSEH
jgi:hypothetical protein